MVEVTYQFSNIAGIMKIVVEVVGYKDGYVSGYGAGGGGRRWISVSAQSTVTDPRVKGGQCTNSDMTYKVYLRATLGRLS